MQNTKKRCPYCSSNKVIKKGLNSTKKKQRYMCKVCTRKFVTDGINWFIDNYKRILIDNMLAERISLRGICRVMNISLSWLYTYVKNLYNDLPDDLNYKAPEEVLSESVDLNLIDSELDEMWSFVGSAIISGFLFFYVNTLSIYFS